MNELRVALVAGGRSPEHEISILSGMEVARHLDRSRYRCLLVRVDREGTWHVAPRFLEQGEEVPAGLEAHGSTALPPGACVERCLEMGVGCFFLALHGPYGEDGTVQGMLDLYQAPYTGSGQAASAVAMDKLRTREALAHHGIPMPRAWVPPVPLEEAEAGRLGHRVGQEVGFPCFLKADRSGSSKGIARCDDIEGFSAALESIRGFGERWLVEEALDGVEVTCACLGNWWQTVEALPPVEIRPVQDAYFTYDAKYDPSKCREICPPERVAKEHVRKVELLARRCHEILCCDGLSRTDMIVTAEGPRVLEVNTIPGLTEVSLLPKAARAAGISFQGLLERLVESALARAARELKGALA